MSDENARPQPAPPSNEWRHIANEWADAATNGLQWLRNVRDGVSKPEDGIAEMENNIPRIRALQPPAPPDGEPVAWAVKDFADGWIIFDNEAKARRCAETTGALIVRLGLAARPKVEDAEVAAYAKELRTFVKDEQSGITQACLEGSADLLERLAGDLQNWRSVAIVAMKAQEVAEAELATADATIAIISPLPRGENEKPIFGEVVRDNLAKACERHAARQQQKDKA